jgi:hypothetical protein
MVWIPIVAWAAAAVLAVVVLGFYAYEISWKATRLQRDIRGLNAVAGDLQSLRGKLEETRERLAASGLG